MRYAIVTLLVIASTAATVALAQDGLGHGPPKASIIVTQPTPAAPGVSLTRVFRPATELASMMR